MRLASGRQMREAMRAEVTEIISDLPAISITSGSSDTMSSMALVRPCHISVNLLPPYLCSSPIISNEAQYYSGSAPI